MRYEAKRNNSGGPGWIIVDITTGRNVAGVFDQVYGTKHPDEDERRAKRFADVLNEVEL